MQLNLIIAGVAVNEINLELERIEHKEKVIFSTDGNYQEILFEDSVLWDSTLDINFNNEWKLVEFIMNELVVRFQIQF